MLLSHGDAATPHCALYWTTFAGRPGAFGSSEPRGEVLGSGVSWIRVLAFCTSASGALGDELPTSPLLSFPVCQYEGEYSINLTRGQWTVNACRHRNVVCFRPDGSRTKPPALATGCSESREWRHPVGAELGAARKEGIFPRGRNAETESSGF